jgi:hypothetical protein
MQNKSWGYNLYNINGDAEDALLRKHMGKDFPQDYSIQLITYLE